jgi:hypothetical protein
MSVRGDFINFNTSARTKQQNYYNHQILLTESVSVNTVLSIMTLINSTK